MSLCTQKFWVRTKVQVISSNPVVPKPQTPAPSYNDRARAGAITEGAEVKLPEKSEAILRQF